MKLYLTRNEAAEILGVHPQTVSNYLAKGLLVESSTRNPESKSLRILGSSVSNLMNEGYDIIEILTAYLKGNDVLQGIRQEYVIDLLSGKRWEYISWKKDVSIESIRLIYVKALREIAEGKKTSIVVMRKEMETLKIQLDLERKRNVVLEEIQVENQIDDDINMILDEHVIRIPNMLVGFRYMSMSVRLHNILRAADFDHFYELALVSRRCIHSIRNCGRKSLNELDLLMEKIGLEFNNIESLNSPKVQSLAGPYIELSVGLLRVRSKELIELLG